MINNDIITWKEKVQKEIAEASGYNLKVQVKQNEECVNRIEKAYGKKTKSHPVK